VRLNSQVGLPGFKPLSFLSSESQLLTWQGQGLPTDALSAQNALAILHAVQTPFIIDPSSQVRNKQQDSCLSAWLLRQWPRCFDCNRMMPGFCVHPWRHAW
jgi:hypothetical protein